MAAANEEEELKQRRRRHPSHRDGFSPSGRPLDYQGSQNWTARIATRTLYAATVGALAGVGFGIYKRQNPFNWLTSVGANCAIATCCFCGFQELTRELRAADPDDWANCLLGGLGSGALLGRLHGGPARVLPTALLFASVGTGIHFGGLMLSEYRMRHLLGSLPSEDKLGAGPPAEREMTLKAWFDFELPEWSPIKKLDKEEAKKRALDIEYQRRKTMESLHTGTYPVEDHR
eukprot:c20795_g1_i1 orf=454-1149(-)